MEKPEQPGAAPSAPQTAPQQREPQTAAQTAARQEETRQPLPAPQGEAQTFPAPQPWEYGQPRVKSKSAALLQWGCALVILLCAASALLTIWDTLGVRASCAGYAAPLAILFSLGESARVNLRHSYNGVPRKMPQRGRNRRLIRAAVSPSHRKKRRLRRRQLRRFCINVCKQPLRKIGFVSHRQQPAEIFTRPYLILSRASKTALLRSATQFGKTLPVAGKVNAPHSYNGVP